MYYPHIPGDQAAIKEEPLTICFCGDAAITADGVPEERGHAPLIPALRGCIWVTLMCLNALVNKMECFRIRLDTSCQGLFPENEEHRRSDILAIPVLPSYETRGQPGRSQYEPRPTWTRVATGVLVPDGRLAESRGTRFSVAQDATLPAGAASALVQVPRLALHVEFPTGGSAHHHVHPIRLTAA